MVEIFYIFPIDNKSNETKTKTKTEFILTSNFSVVKVWYIELDSCLKRHRWVSGWRGDILSHKHSLKHQLCIYSWLKMVPNNVPIYAAVTNFPIDIWKGDFLLFFYSDIICNYRFGSFSYFWILPLLLLDLVLSDLRHDLALFLDC